MTWPTEVTLQMISVTAQDSAHLEVHGIVDHNGFVDLYVKLPLFMLIYFKLIYPLNCVPAVSAGTQFSGYHSKQ